MTLRGLSFNGAKTMTWTTLLFTSAALKEMVVSPRATPSTVCSVPLTAFTVTIEEPSTGCSWMNGNTLASKLWPRVSKRWTLIATLLPCSILSATSNSIRDSPTTYTVDYFNNNKLSFLVFVSMLKVERT